MGRRATASVRRSGGSLRDRARGFTLIELAASLAVMALAIGLVVPALDGGFRTREVWRTTRQFASTLRHLRSHAVASGEIHELVIDPEHNSYETTVFAESVHLSEDAVFVSVDGGSVAGGDLIRVLFFPNGGTSGLDTVVGTRDDPEGARYRVTLDPLIGTIAIGDARA
jgi:prepilin-type N-terminal cleavage/methylation domain-containing protein